MAPPAFWQGCFAAQDRQANGCLHTNSSAGRKDMEHEVRNVRVRNRVGVSLLDLKGENQYIQDRNSKPRLWAGYDGTRSAGSEYRGTNENPVP